MIETLNENKLHNQLKHIFCPKDAQLECKVGSFICDIVSIDGKIIEIQTGHFANMQKKLNLLLKSHSVEIVYPISVDTYIRSLNEDYSEKSCRKSPVHGSIFQLCRELTKLIDLIHHPNLSLRVVYIESITTKINDKKGRSRYKNPRIIEKELKKIISEKYYNTIFDSILDMLLLLPETFSTEDIEKDGSKKHSNYAIWFFKKLNLIKETDKIKRRKIYTKTH